MRPVVVDPKGKAKTAPEVRRRLRMGLGEAVVVPMDMATPLPAGEEGTAPPASVANLGTTAIATYLAMAAVMPIRSI